MLLLLDVDVSSPDEKSVITYVSSLYDAFPKVPEGGEGIGANVSIDFFFFLFWKLLIRECLLNRIL